MLNLDHVRNKQDASDGEGMISESVARGLLDNVFESTHRSLGQGCKVHGDVLLELGKLSRVVQSPEAFNVEVDLFHLSKHSGAVNTKLLDGFRH
jgi:hypothetical protein